MTKSQRKLKNINSKKYILLNDFKRVIGKDKITAHHKSFLKTHKPLFSRMVFDYKNLSYLEENL
jgi:hypothetical protein